MGTRRMGNGVRAVLMVSALLLASACGDGTDSAGVQPPNTSSTVPLSVEQAVPTSLTFDWGERCRVPVFEKVDRDGTVGEVTYDVVLSPQPSTGGWLLDFADVVIEKIDGEPVPESARDQLSASFLRPMVEIDPDGIAVGLVGYDEFIERLIALMGFGPDSAEAANARSPAFRAALEETSTWKTWGAWVGLWANLGYVDPGPVEYVTEHQTATGTVIEMPFTVEHLGRIPSGEVVLRYTEVLDGEDLAILTGDRLGSIVPDMTDEPAFNNTERTIEIEVVTDPETLQPSSARYESLVSDGSASRHEVRDLRFDFESAEGCR